MRLAVSGAKECPLSRYAQPLDPARGHRSSPRSLSRRSSKSWKQWPKHSTLSTIPDPATERAATTTEGGLAPGVATGRPSHDGSAESRRWSIVDKRGNRDGASDSVPWSFEARRVRNASEAFSHTTAGHSWRQLERADPRGLSCYQLTLGPRRAGGRGARALGRREVLRKMPRGCGDPKAIAGLQWSASKEQARARERERKKRKRLRASLRR